MDRSMTLNKTLALFGAMVSLAAMPGVSVPTVTARSAASGFVHGAFTALGIVVDDIVFILVAVLPFRNIRNDPEQEYFCDGIITDLFDVVDAYSQPMMCFSRDLHWRRARSCGFADNVDCFATTVTKLKSYCLRVSCIVVAVRPAIIPAYA